MLKHILEDLKKIKSTIKELREFGFVVGGVLAVIAAFLWWKQRHFVTLAAIAGFLIFFGAVYPAALRPFQKVWMGIAVVIGAFMSRVILSILFFLVLTPLSLFSRLLGKKYLNLNFREPVESYWIKRPAQPDKTRYEKQY
jgi:hypothetical protein